MIYYVNNKIYDWNFEDDNIVKVYRDGVVCYYKMVAGSTAQTPCYAVVDDITKYSDTEFVDVYDKATSKWYKLNNLNDYEEYGVYGEGRNITYYEGKLTIDTDKEYIYSGSGWTYVGDVSGGTASLPDVAFSLNYNAKDYDATNHLFPKTSGQSVNVDATLQGTYGLTAHTEDGYVSYSGANGQTGALIGGYQNYINRGNTSGNCELTIVSKQKRTGNNADAHSLLANRDATNYNWMWRIKNNIATLHGTSELGDIAISTSEPNIISVRVGYDGGAKVYYNNWTQETSTSPLSFTYGNLNTNGFAMFNGYYTHKTNSSKETFEGDFYWVYMTPNELTDEQIQAVIDFNEGGGTTVYPLYYTVKQDPPQNLVFADMAEAEAYRCPYVGLKATIGGDLYIFSKVGNDYEWVALAYTLRGTTKSSTDFTLKINGADVTATVYEDNGDNTYNWGIVYTDPITSVTQMASGNTNLLTFDWGTADTRQLTSIGSDAFRGCSAMTSVDIPSGITSIDSYVFNNCKSLTSITIPNGVTTIKQYAFYECTNLTSLVLPNSLTSFNDYAFGRLFNLTSISIPSGVTSIANGAFFNSSGLTSISIPSGVTSIANSAFYQCRKLASITIPSGVTAINNSTFYNCYSLTSIAIPSGVTTIGSNAFSRCSSLSSITINATTPPSLDNVNAFRNTNNCPIYVPAQSVEAYKTATNWSTYADRIVGI